MLNREETSATISTTFAYRFSTAKFHLIEFKRVVGWEPRGAHLLLRQVVGRAVSRLSVASPRTPTGGPAENLAGTNFGGLFTIRTAVGAWRQGGYQTRTARALAFIQLTCSDGRIGLCRIALCLRRNPHGARFLI